MLLLLFGDGSLFLSHIEKNNGRKMIMNEKLVDFLIKNFYAAYHFSPLYPCRPQISVVTLEMNGFA